MNGYPTPWQQKTIWAALTGLSIVAIGATAVGLIWITSRILGFLQPILIPFAVAGVMAYLLDPLVSKIVAWGTSRQRAVLFVFAFVSILFGGVLVWIIPAISHQSIRLAQNIPRYTQAAKERVLEFAEQVEARMNVHLLPDFRAADAGAPDANATTAPATTETPNV